MINKPAHELTNCKNELIRSHARQIILSKISGKANGREWQLVQVSKQAGATMWKLPDASFEVLQG